MIVSRASKCVTKMKLEDNGIFFDEEMHAKMKKHLSKKRNSVDSNENILQVRSKMINGLKIIVMFRLVISRRSKNRNLPIRRKNKSSTTS